MRGLTSPRRKNRSEPERHGRSAESSHRARTYSRSFRAIWRLVASWARGPTGAPLPGAVSRLLDKIVSVAVKGPSSGGKSYLVKEVMSFFPERSDSASSRR